MSFAAVHHKPGLRRIVVLAALLVAVLSLSGCSGGSSGSNLGGNTAANNPLPAISSLSPAAAQAGSTSFLLTVNGNNISPGAVVSWGGQSRTTNYVNASQVTATIEAADVVSVGTANVTVTNPTPGGGTSGSLPFTIYAPVPPLTSRTDWKYLGAKVDAGDDNEPPLQVMVYDAARQQVFVSVLARNLVLVFDAQTHLQKAAIPVPTPLCMDLSPDGSTLYIGTGTSRVYALNAATLHVRQVLDSAGVLPGGFSAASLFTLNDGRLFILPGAGVDGAGNPILWSIASGTAKVITTALIGAATRSADHSSVLVASPDTSGNISIFSTATDQFISTPYPPADIVQRVAANPVRDQFAVSDLNGNVFVYDSHLQLLGSMRIEPVGQFGGQRLNGMVFSGDGSRLHLFVDQTIQEYDTSAFQQQGVMAQPYAVGIFADPLPYAEDNSDLIFAVNEEGLDFIDVSTIHNSGLKSVPFGFSYGLVYLSPNTGSASGGTAISSSVSAPSAETVSVASAYVGRTGVWNLSASDRTYSFQTPASASSGSQNLIVTLSDGTLLLAPLAFSYGPDVARLVTTVGDTQGGGTGFVAGYGFGTSATDLQIQVGGQAATVSSVGVPLKDLDSPFPTPITSATFTIPKGSPGMADVTLTTASGSTKLPGAFRYIPPATLHTNVVPLEAGVYDSHRKVIYFTSTSQVLIWSVAAGQWLNPIPVPHSATAQLLGISISPDGQTVAVTDQGNQAVVVFNPDSSQSIRSLPVPDGGFGLKPVSVAVGDHGKAYFNLSFTYRDGFGTRCQNSLVWSLDVSTGATTDLGGPGCMFITDRVLLSPDGSTLFLDSAGALSVYDITTGQWTTNGGGQGSADMAISSDGSRLIQNFDVYDSLQGYVGTPAWSDITLSDQQDYRLGERLDQTGTLLFQPWSHALDIVDLGHFEQKQRVALDYPIPDVFDPMVWDGDNDTAYLIAQGGLLEVPLAPLPLVLRSLSPTSGNAGTLVTLTGSGFATGMTATVDGMAIPLTILDEHTATVTMPAHASGAVVVSIGSVIGGSSFLDPGFSYDASAAAATARPVWRVLHKRTLNGLASGSTPRPLHKSH